MWRIEWQVRKALLRQFGICTFADLQKLQGDLLRYCARSTRRSGCGPRRATAPAGRCIRSGWISRPGCRAAPASGSAASMGSRQPWRNGSSSTRSASMGTERHGGRALRAAPAADRLPRRGPAAAPAPGRGHPRSARVGHGGPETDRRDRARGMVSKEHPGGAECAPQSVAVLVGSIAPEGKFPVCRKLILEEFGRDGFGKDFDGLLARRNGRNGTARAGLYHARRAVRYEWLTKPAGSRSSWTGGSRRERRCPRKRWPWSRPVAGVAAAREGAPRRRGVAP